MAENTLHAHRSTLTSRLSTASKMANPHSPYPATLKFGRFEVSARTGELRKSGVPVRLLGQPIQILLNLLTHPGEVVTREQLRADIWGDATFVDFEHGLNAAISKLRRALGDSAENPRFIETVPARGYRFIGSVTEAAPKTTEEADRSAVDAAALVPAPISLAPPGDQRLGNWRRWWWWWPAVAALLAVGAGAWWRLSPVVSPLAPPSWKMTRLTADTGLSTSPALSPDGKLVAYSSDREGAGRQDLYVQQVAGGGHPIRLTFDGAGNTTPDFSPDGGKLVFRSSRDGGGIYEIPAFAGEARFLARDGFHPKYSPDGKVVAYWVGAENIAHAVPGNGVIWVAPVAGGRPRQVATKLASARQPIWSPDGKRLLVIGYASQAVYDNSALDWWLVPAQDGTGHAARAGVLDALARAEVQTRDAVGNLARSIPAAAAPRPRCWLAADSTVVFSTEHGDTRSLWAAHLAEDGRMTGEVRRLTAGADQEVDPSCAANGSIAFANQDSRAQVWWLPFDPVRGSATGALRRITSGLAREEHPSISEDGRRAAFISDQAGLRSVWMLDLTSGKQTRVAPSPFAQRYPVLSSSGKRVAFASYERDKRLVYVAAAVGGTSELVCGDCLRPTDWSRDETGILVVDGSPYRISQIDAATRKQTVLIQHASFHAIYGRFSPDNRWISFTVRHPNNRSWVAIAPLEGTAKPIGEEAWIQISEEGPEDRANWSPDGKTLYFTSGRDGRLCLWGQRIDGVTHRPVGEPFAAHHFHERPVFQQLGWSLAGGRAAMALMESTGNIWMMSRPGSR